MGKLLALIVIVMFLVLLVSGVNELHIQPGQALAQTPTPAPTSVPVLAMIGRASARASEAPICNAGFLFIAAIALGTVTMYQWLSRS